MAIKMHRLQDRRSATDIPLREAANEVTRRATIGLILIWLCLGTAWSLALPPLQAPDELAHVDIVRHTASDGTYPRDAFPIAREQIGALRWTRQHQTEQRFTEAMPSRSDRPSFAALAADGDGTLPNQMYQHPPVGYVHLLLAEEVLDTLESEVSFDLHLWLLRISNVLLCGGIPYFLLRATTVLGGSARQATVAALLPLAVPQLAATLGSTNNDAPLVLLSAAATWAAALMLRGDRGAVPLGLTLGLTGLTKGFGLALFVLPTAAVIRRPRWWRGGITALVIGLVGCGWWWIWNLSRFGDVQPHGMPIDELLGGPVREGGRIWDWVTESAPLLIDRFWGSFGSFSLGIGLPRWLTLLATVALVTAVVNGCRLGSPAVRQLAGLQVAVLVAALAILAKGSFDLFDTYGELLGVQGRYLFVAVPGLAVVAAIGVERSLPARSVVPVALMIVVAMQVAAFVAVLNGFWGTAQASLGARLRAAANWAPLSPKGLLVVIAGGLTIGALVVLRADRASSPPAGG